MTKKNLYKNEPAPVREDQSSRTTENHGSTTQGGSNFGQGSHQLGKQAQRQGETSDNGANYDSEEGWKNESLRTEDIDDPGQPKEK